MPAALENLFGRGDEHHVAHKVYAVIMRHWNEIKPLGRLPCPSTGRMSKASLIESFLALYGQLRDRHM